MGNICRYIFFVLIFFQCIACGGQEYSKFVILICSYNNAQYVEANILSAVTQKYQHFRVIYVDDASTDNTCQILEEVLKRVGKTHLVKIIRNEKNQGSPLPNHYYAIHHAIADDEIVVLLDGDDCLSNRFVLSALNRVYHKKQETWLTYGQFQGMQSKGLGWCCAYPEDIIQRNAFREFIHMPSHLKTFYAWLFKKIRKEDLMYEGEFYRMSGDLAIMLPMIEMAKNHHRFISQIFYLYNEDNMISDHRKNFEEQMRVARYIRSLPPYTPLD
jgi:glycosyltransferase involved in cell wall biosynthesis